MHAPMKGGLTAPASCLLLTLVVGISSAACGGTDNTDGGDGDASAAGGMPNNGSGGSPQGSGGDASATGGTTGTGGSDDPGTGGDGSVGGWRDDFVNGLAAICDRRCAGREDLACVEEQTRDACVNDCEVDFTQWLETCPEPVGAFLDCAEQSPGASEFTCKPDDTLEPEDPVCNPDREAVVTCLSM